MFVWTLQRISFQTFVIVRSWLCSFIFQNIGELGLKTKYFSSEYRKPLCVELEDVKINKTAENDLETLSRIQLVETSCESSKMRKDTKAVNARYVKWLQESSTSFLNYLLQFLPPTAMIMLQVFLSCVIQDFIRYNLFFFPHPAFRNSR